MRRTAATQLYYDVTNKGSDDDDDGDEDDDDADVGRNLIQPAFSQELPLSANTAL